MADSTTIVIFGASGDLTQRKLIPALFNLFRKQRLPADFRIVGFAVTPWRDADFRAAMRNGVDQQAQPAYPAEDWTVFEARLFYRTGSFTEAADFERLSAALTDLETGPVDRLYYLATPPRFYADIVNQLGAAGLAREDNGRRRVIIEKPFGTDLASAQALNQAIHRVLAEQQIYRIDHYLGKETVQNILALRFANAIFEPLWNRNYIDHVQITVAETVGVGHRAGYYDQAGVLRDMFQNHLLQLTAMTAMEPPDSFDADSLRNEKVKVFKALRPIPADQVQNHTVRGQYRGYRQEADVQPDSRTPTFAAVQLFIDNWRWQGVPFYLRSGKLLAAKTTEIIIQFKCPPHLMFPLPPDRDFTSNILALCLQPDEGVHLRFEAKVPDTVTEMRSVDMEFHYADSFGPRAIPEAYERLLLDALHGDASLFTRSDGIEFAWKFIDPILKGWTSQTIPPAEYEPGSWGPAAADELLAREGRAWVRGCGQHPTT